MPVDVRTCEHVYSPKGDTSYSQVDQVAQVGKGMARQDAAGDEGENYATAVLWKPQDGTSCCQPGSNSKSTSSNSCALSALHAAPVVLADN
ncbi:GM12335 [Drosophila sechellia]|uniref:GM12335 n=1 Tax=Drosophila sechellia TaxID=7238 RepID=B4I109_DROSE|nr:GM12335 [Drosophila sechellia]